MFICVMCKIRLCVVHIVINVAFVRWVLFVCICCVCLHVLGDVRMVLVDYV